MRLIDADAELKEAKELSGQQTGDGWDNWGVYALIERQPTIDAEPIVRCKDCEYWRNDDCKNDNHGYCPISENDFCSRGVRKERR